ncbi:MAG: bifunctional riboflavin kinase/FAD synthetase [Actinomycetota bacterium]
MRSDGIALWQGLNAVPDGVRAAVTIGVFDGVHRGHQALMREVLQRARENDAIPVVVTFDRHPLSVIAPDKEPAVITTLRQRARAMGDVGIGAILVLRFDDELRHLSAEDFVKRVLVDTLGCVHAVVGANFRFGFQQQGTIETLSDLGAKYGFGVTIFALQTARTEDVVSSSLIRRHIAEGKVEEAAAELTRPFRLEGYVEHGAGRGKTLGFPTANLRIPGRMLLPRLGVYAGWLDVDGARLPAVINVGLNPTFGDRDTPIVEAYALDFDGDLYGKVVELEFTHRLRDEMKFESADALVEQIKQDVARGRALLTG